MEEAQVVEEQAFPLKLDRDELSGKLGGGLPKNSFMLIEAQNALGKSVLAQRFAYSMVSHKQKVTYISTEMNTAGFLNQMRSLDYDIKESYLKGEFLFISMFPFLGQARLGPDFLLKLRNKRLFDSDVIIFDTLSDMLIPDDITLGETFEIIKFFKKITSEEKTIIFCVDPDHFENHFAKKLKAVSDIYLRIYEKEQYGNLLKIIKVERFNGATADVTAQIPFKVRAGIGIVIEIAST